MYVMIDEVKWKLLSHVRLFATPWTTVHGILQARILEWVAFPFSRYDRWDVLKVKLAVD